MEKLIFITFLVFVGSLGVLSDIIVGPSIFDPRYGVGYYKKATLKLECSKAHDHNRPYKLYFEYPDQSRKLDKDRLAEVSEELSKVTGGSELVLTIRNITVKDQGKYTCVYEDEFQNQGSTDRTLSVSDIGDNYLVIHNDRDFTYRVHNLFGRLIRKDVLLQVDIDSYPSFTVTWYDNNGIKISEYDNNYEIRKDGLGSDLYVKNAYKSDAGNYRVEANNGFETKSHYVKLEV